MHTINGTVIKATNIICMMIQHATGCNKVVPRLLQPCKIWLQPATRDMYMYNCNVQPLTLKFQLSVQ